MPKAIAVTTDLLFSSRISGTGEALGVSVQVVRAADALEAALADGDVRLVMVDMAMPRETACACIQSAAQHASSPVTVAFYSHVDAAARDAAQSAGAQHLMPRSKFTAELPDIFRRFCVTGG